MEFKSDDHPQIGSSRNWGPDVPSRLCPGDGLYNGATQPPLSGPLQTPFFPGGDRWSAHYPSPRVLTPQADRQEMNWPLLLPNAGDHHGGQGRRDEFASTASSQPWPLQSHSRLWQPDTYSLPPAPADMFIDRSRLRTHSPYNPALMSRNRAEHEGAAPGGGTAYPETGQRTGNHDVGSARLAWLLPSASDGDRSRRIHQPQSSFAPHTPLPSVEQFSQGHTYNSPGPHSYASTWSSSSMGSPSSSAEFSPETHVSPYDSAYASAARSEDGLDYPHAGE